MTIISRILYKTIVSKSEKKVYFDRSRKTGMTMSYLVTKVFIEFDSSCGYSKIRRFETRKLLVWGILFWYDFWISGWNSGKHWHYWIHNVLTQGNYDHHPPPPARLAASTYEMCYQPVENKTPAVWFISPGCIRDDSPGWPGRSWWSSPTFRQFHIFRINCSRWDGVMGSEKAEIAK